MNANTKDLSASYSRRSKDLDHAGLNVATQERDNVDRANGNGHTITDDYKYTDNDTSASRFAKVQRTDWLRLRHDIEHGPVMHIYTLMLDRLLRLPGELEWLIDQAFVGNFRSIVTDEEVLDLTTDGGIARARGMAAAADMEVRKLSKRVRRAFAEKRNNGGSHQPVIALGWLGTRHGHGNNNGDTIHEYEAAYIRDAAKRVLAGIPMATIAAEWTAEGLLKPKAMHHAAKDDKPVKVQPWNSNEVRRVVSSPRNAGLTTHDGEVVHRSNVRIIDPATHAKITALLARRATSPTKDSSKRGKWTGVVRCGALLDDGQPCGATMCYQTASKHGAAMFKCLGRPGRRACGRNNIVAHIVETVAYEWLPSYVDDDAALRRGVIREDASLESAAVELSMLATRKKETLEDRALGRLTRAEANQVVDTINAREAELSRKLTASGARDSLSPWLGDGDGVLAWMQSEKCSAAEHRAVFMATDHFVWITPRPEAKASRANNARARIIVNEEHPAIGKRARGRKVA